MVSPVPRQETLAVVPALIAAAASIFLIRSGFFLLFFLMPFGFIGFRYNGRSMWACFGAAAVANGFLVAGTLLVQKIPAGEMLWDIVFFTSMGAVFTWITAPIQGKTDGAFSKIPGVYRFIIGSVLCAVVFMGLFFRALGDQLFYNVLRQQVESITALYKSGSSDVVQNALLESLTPELVLDAAKSLVLRGGALVSLVLIFAINRQGSIVLARLFKSPYQGGNLRTFHVHSRFISVLSVTLALLVVTRMLKWAWPEIVLWNILVLCVILYLAQGLGILQHFLARPVMPPFARLLLPLLFIIMIFSPGINAVLLGIIVILGIAENWAPFRAPKKDGPPSTPEA
jgi:hypothetical protein